MNKVILVLVVSLLVGCGGHIDETGLKEANQLCSSHSGLQNILVTPSLDDILCNDGSIISIQLDPDTLKSKLGK